MPDATTIQQFERRLIELGCPARQLRSRVRELADHYQDLQEAEQADGFSEAEAAARAAARLGDPIVLAENLVLDLRQASWWGRHPVIGFCLLPPCLRLLGQSRLSRRNVRCSGFQFIRHIVFTARAGGGA